jgi:sugar phosphate isomerase/epimerase
MRLSSPGAPHLTYCTNIHPGESWEEVRGNLDRYTLPVKQTVAPDRPFGLGLRLSARAADQLARPSEVDSLRDYLAESGLYMFTFNGFPYGPFHGTPVKEDVYLPDWTNEARLTYTDQLADILAALLPADSSIEGTISTVPGAFRELARVSNAVEAMTAMIARHAAHLYRVREETGRSIVLALEPEPCCYLELAEEAISFLREHLWRRATVERFTSLTGLAGDAAEEFLRQQVGVCLDTCHMAVEYEECEASVRALQAAGVRIAKAQITAGLQVDFDGSRNRDAQKLDALRSFADEVYLHQVVERRAGGVRRHLDLPQALAEWAEKGPPRECRIHFHVPVFREELGAFRGTQGYVAEFLELVRAEAITPHLEVETYTWGVLPEAYRRESIVEAVAGELRWVLERVPA